MNKPRTTIRRLIAIVLLIGVAIWAGLAAQRTRSNKARFHTHLQSLGDPDDPNWEFTVTPEWVPFWPVYWRTLLGLRWDWRLECISGDVRREIACEHDFPQMNAQDDPDKFAGFGFKRLQAIFDTQSPSRR
jgi:hypothetical protein